MSAEPTEGWMGEKRQETRRYHYIVDGLPLCKRLGFYAGELQAYDPESGQRRDDCTECYRRQQKRAAAREAVKRGK